MWMRETASMLAIIAGTNKQCSGLIGWQWWSLLQLFHRSQECICLCMLAVFINVNVLFSYYLLFISCFVCLFYHYLIVDVCRQTFTRLRDECLCYLSLYSSSWVQTYWVCAYTDSHWLYVCSIIYYLFEYSNFWIEFLSHVVMASNCQ